ncbi:TIGR00730 family Rossman fold protein [Acidiphilium sp. PA]|uniref:LOG family protein n=1 Tax=Acidiphilium sp. PA TaxID=2871705 RepID=UPI0022441E3F|nr:TIGR00730 family Rossman fold protein [Acidiphilium sp. PA]MCW8306613.1 TIGR00730 family Rossman fold protein [Acidiphilium sp. PA]
MSHISVTVFCGSSPGMSPDYLAAAHALGEGIARHGMKLVFGGGNVGLMGAVAGAARGAGGHVTGIIPDFLRAREIEFPGLSELIVTDSMHTRKRRMFARADAFVVLPGGLGTLDELMEILTWKQLERHAKPIILIDILGWATQVAALLDAVITAGFAKPSARDLFEIVADVPATLARLEAYSPSSAAGSSVETL